MTPSSLNALAALLGAAGFPETWYENGKGIFGKQRSLRARAVHIDGPINFEVAAVHNKGDAALIVAAVNALPDLIEAARREAAARFVAEHWRGEYMEGIEAGDSKWAIGTHPLAMVLAALDGETDPRQLGLPESADDTLAPSSTTTPGPLHGPRCLRKGRNDRTAR